MAEARRGAGDGACPLPTVVSPWKVVEDYVLKEWSASDGLGRRSVNQRKSLTVWVAGSWLGGQASPEAEPEASMHVGVISSGSALRGPQEKGRSQARECFRLILRVSPRVPRQPF